MKSLNECNFLLCVDVFPLKTESKNLTYLPSFKHSFEPQVPILYC